MKRFIGIALATLLTAVACSSTTPTISPSPSITTSHPTSTLIGCYGVWQGKNHYNVEITAASDADFQAVMTYDNYQFDSSQGTLRGTVANGVLLGVYRFIAEGSYNERELIFKVSGGALIQGSGPMKMVDGREVFVDSGSVVWDPTFTFIREARCPAPWK
jgi:hypothetical protein